MATDSPIHIFGIRHHGPGSARSLAEALEALQPDCILIEGPPDAEDVLSFAAHAEMKPPVALLIYDPEKPSRSAYYPFAAFSPEWQAIQFGLEQKLPVRFMDLPQTVHIALAAEEEAKAAAEKPDPSVEQDESVEESDDEGQEGPEIIPSPETQPELSKAIGLITHQDPLSYLAQAAGYSDSERWWEHMVEHRSDGEDIFAAILQAMTALREAALESWLQKFEPEREAKREAWMRQTIRGAQKEGFGKIAVVCGAWHAPILANMPAAKEDAALLKNLPKRKVVATWIPWTYSRLAAASGYGAGIESPGWYDFLWKLGKKRRAGDISTGWLVKVARLLRSEDLDASSASIIETVRLAECLAAVRNRPLPGLPELNEATQTVLCFGDPLPLRLINQKLIVSERLGEVPDETPMVPLAQDLAREQKRLKLRPEALAREIDLDLRKPNDLDRSRLLHRLTLLGIKWGERQQQRSAQKGTFHELWTLQWEPEFAVTLIESGVWGNTIPDAAGAKIRHEADNAPELSTLTALLDSTLLANLPDAAAHLMSRLQAVAALASDVGHLMGALPPLANIFRYGNVRQADATMVAGLVDGLVARICIGLPGACGSLNDEAAEEMFNRILATHNAIGLLENSEQLSQWHGVLRQLEQSLNLHGLIAGRACRLLLDAQQLDLKEAARRFSLVLSTANAPNQAACWVDGFLRNSGLLLLHDEALWNVLDEWVTNLSADHFTAILPLLRRTFSTFAPPERRQMGERVTCGAGTQITPRLAPADFDVERAKKVLPLVAQLLGVKFPP
jgi:hypothetical protein